MNNNPFADAGKVITGSRFVGRKKFLLEIEQYVLGETLGNLSVVGMPRVGKSSLIWNAIMNRENELIARNIIPIFIYCKNHQSDASLLEAIVNEVYANMLVKFSDFDLKPLTKIINLIKKDSTFVEKKIKIKHFLETLKILNIRTVCILDDFDHARYIFNPSSFNFLREIASRVSIGLSLITISQRTIFEIEKYVEKRIDQNSKPYLFNVVSNTLYLDLFNENDLKEYWERFFLGEIRKEHMAIIYKTTGAHPYILDMYNFKLWNEISNGLTVEHAIAKVTRVTSFSEIYHYLIMFLKDENLDEKLYNIIIAPDSIISNEDVIKMQNYGLIQIENGEYTSFSENFSEYIKTLVVGSNSLLMTEKNDTLENTSERLNQGAINDESPVDSISTNDKRTFFMNKNLVFKIIIALALSLTFIFFAKPNSEINFWGLFNIKQGNSKIIDSNIKDKDNDYVTVVGTIKINGLNAKSEDIKKIYIKDNTLIAPVTLDDSRFKLQNIPTPTDNLVTIEIELSSGITKSALFNLPKPNSNHVSDLKEVLIEIKKTDSHKRNNSNTLTIINQNIQNN